MGALWSAFTGSTVGKYVVGGVAGVAFLLTVIGASFKQGKTSAKAAQTEEVLDAVKEKNKSDEEVASLSDAERRAKLLQWSRN